MQRVPTYRPTLIEALGGQPTKAEQKLLAAAKAGEMVQLRPDGLRPEKPTAATRIRAGLIRFLMLGGDESYVVHPKGVMIRSAFISGKLDLEACETQLDLKLFACAFDVMPDFDDAQLGGLYLSGCWLPGLTAQRIRVFEDLLLCAFQLSDGNRLPFISIGTIDLMGARIAGQLDCSGGRFDGITGVALDADAMVAGSDVFLRDNFHATGCVSLIRAKIAGQLSCSGGRFDGVAGPALNGDTLVVGSDVFLRGGFHATGLVKLTGANIVGQLVCSTCRIEGELNLQSAKIGGEFFLQKIEGDDPYGPGHEDATAPTFPAGHRFCLDLREARVGVLADDTASWAAAQKAKVSGFQYKSVQSSIALADRLALLRRVSEGDRFDPGPFSRHAVILRRSGHRVDADRVLFLRERMLRSAERDETWKRGGKWRFLSALMSIRDGFFQTLIGFGYRPAFAVLWAVLIITFSTLFFADVYRVGQFAPNSDVILNSAHWLAAVEKSDALKTEGFDISPQHLWIGLGETIPPMPPSIDYETFHPFLYAVDLFLPLNTIGQTEAWAPSKDRGWWGRVGYYARMPIQLSGWLITALVAALLTGLIGRRED
jgi:hypothetical protein